MNIFEVNDKNKKEFLEYAEKVDWRQLKSFQNL